MLRTVGHAEMDSPTLPFKTLLVGQFHSMAAEEVLVMRIEINHGSFSLLGLTRAELRKLASTLIEAGIVEEHTIELALSISADVNEVLSDFPKST